MGAIYSGLISNNGYLFITNDTFGVTEDECAIVRVNKLCGAFIVTAKGDLLIRVREVLYRSLFKLKDKYKGLSEDLAKAIVESFKKEFQDKPYFKKNPLPFLLLLVGYNLNRSKTLEHIFIRNRIVNVTTNDNKREYVTDFEIQSSVSAGNLFYGHSEISQYLSNLLPLNTLTIEITKLLSYFSISETQAIDRSIYPGVRMAVISKDSGFKWVTGEELNKLSEIAKTLNVRLSEGMSAFSNDEKKI